LTDSPDEYDEFSLSDVTSIFKQKDSESSTGVSSTSSLNNGGGGFSNVLAGLLGITAAIAPVLPSIGVGSKSRIAETKAIADANSQIYNSQTQASLAKMEAEKQNTKELLYIVGGIVLGFIAIMILRR
jgi:hypothetical protein